MSQRSRKEIEQVVCEIWRELLGLDRVSAETEFIAAGGTSIKAEQIASRTREALAVDVKGSDVLRGDTLSDFVAAISRRLEVVA